MYKLYCILWKPAIQNMKGNRGQMVTQGGHAFLHSFFDSLDRFPIDAMKYRAQNSAFKITLVTENFDDLIDLHAHYRELCGVSLVQERGTRLDKEINENVIGTTALGIGPIHVDLIEERLSNLKTFL